MRFNLEVYRLCKKIPEGMVSSYGLIARRLKSKSYRAVGNALNKNEDNEIPCHRVVLSSGFVGGFNKGVNEKIRRLEKEGIIVKKNKIVDFKKKLFYV